MKKALGWLIAIIIVVLIVMAVSKGGNSNIGPIKIGFIGALTGDVSGLGTASQAAVQIATDEINGSGGINGRQIQVIYEDGQCLPGPATSAASKLISIDKVAGIIGGLCSSETSAFAPQAMQNKVVAISYCSSAPALSSMGKYFFRTYGKFSSEMQLLLLMI